MNHPRTGNRSLWLAVALLALLLAQAAVLAHDATAQHTDDSLCQLCLAGNSVGSAIGGQAPDALPSPPATSPPISPAERLFQRPAAPWQARAPPFLP